MKLHAILAAALSVASPALASDPGPLPRATPESQGVSPAAVLDFIDSADRTIDAMHGFVLVRHGKVVAEGWWTPYDAETPHALYSLSKSFTSTAVGLAIAEGKLRVSDPVLGFFPDDAPKEPSKNLESMRVADLLRMSTGHQAEPPVAATTDKPWTATFLAQAVPFKPGTHFLYNTPATYMLSATVQKATGETVLDYLRPRLFDPLAIRNPSWGTSPQGVTLGGYGLSIRTEDIAKFGQLYLQRGVWEGKQLVPEAWVAEATARQTSNGSNPKSDWDQGYGYQFWRSRNGAFRGDGAFGQYCIVLPDQDAVIAINSGVRDMQAVLDLVWDKLLPALQSSALPDDETSRKALQDRLGRLSLPTVEGTGPSHEAASLAAKTYSFPENDQRIESISLERGTDGLAATLVVRSAGSEQRIPCGDGEWKKARVALGGFPDQPAAICGGWTGEDSFKAKICLCETPFIQTLTLRIADGKLLLDSESNVGFGPTKRPTLEGTAD